MTADGENLPGTPDGFERLWTAHRMVYINANAAPGARACPFCEVPTLDDEAGLIVHRGDECYVVMNLYPYNPGHVLVCPYRHVADYTDLTLMETAEVASLTQKAMAVIRQVSAPAGFNLGMNQGEVAGAGIAAHLHQHIVPRWLGDANFLPIVGQTKAVPQFLADTRAQLAQAWQA